MNTQLIQAIEADRDAMVDFTRRLVAVSTENPPGTNYRACVDLIERELRSIGLDAAVIETPETDVHRIDGASLPRYAVQSFYGTGARTLYFHGHYDVVPASHPTQFQPMMKRGQLFGRGSSDMKSGLAAMIYAVKALKACSMDLDGKIGLMIVPDEETGGILGSQYLTSIGVLGRDGIGMLTPEPTSGVIWNANRGAVSLRVTVKGKPAHVGLQHQGVNAFERMLDVARALQELKTEVEIRETSYAITPAAARRSILMLGGECEGGTNFNLVPGACSFTVDRRINPEENLIEEKQRLMDLFDRLKRNGIDLDVEALQEGRSSGVSEEDPIALALARSVETVTGRQAEFSLCPGLLEIRFYVQQGIPAFAYGPGLLSVSHGPNEFVKVKDIVSCATVYALTALRALNG